GFPSPGLPSPPYGSLDASHLPRVKSFQSYDGPSTPPYDGPLSPPLSISGRFATKQEPSLLEGERNYGGQYASTQRYPVSVGTRGPALLRPPGDRLPLEMVSLAHMGPSQTDGYSE
ncbi:hypothetical protein CRUP_008694, partial [Coryphaenoides rupestris]